MMTKRDTGPEPDPRDIFVVTLARVLSKMRIVVIVGTVLVIALILYAVAWHMK